jgi:hypothetical protein
VVYVADPQAARIAFLEDALAESDARIADALRMLESERVRAEKAEALLKERCITRVALDLKNRMEAAESALAAAMSRVREQEEREHDLLEQASVWGRHVEQVEAERDAARADAVREFVEYYADYRERTKGNIITRTVQSIMNEFLSAARKEPTE